MNNKNYFGVLYFFWDEETKHLESEGISIAVLFPPNKDLKQNKNNIRKNIRDDEEFIDENLSLIKEKKKMKFSNKSNSICFEIVANKLLFLNGRSPTILELHSKVWYLFVVLIIFHVKWHQSKIHSFCLHTILNILL